VLVSLKEILPTAASKSYIVPGFNIFGMDEAWHIMKAAEEENSPVILMVNKDMVKKYSVEVLGVMLNSIAKKSSGPVCVHLDHSYEESIIYRAMDAGFSSVMFDGSQLPMEENISRTRVIADAAHAKGISVEGEIGSVPYPDEDEIKDEKTTPEQALEFSERSGVDAMAVSVGNIHKLTQPKAVIDQTLIKEIEKITETPLVLHGTSGISSFDMKVIVNSRIAKCNIGTLLRQAWGRTLRQEFGAQSEAFDRLTLTKGALQAIQEVATEKIRELGAAGKA
jgi:fructose-bisphosphate aldolase class II